MKMSGSTIGVLAFVLTAAVAVGYAGCLLWTGGDLGRTASVLGLPLPLVLLVVGLLGDVVRGTLEDDSPIPFLPAARLGALARWESQRYSLSVDVRHAFAQDRVPDAVIENDPAATATDAYTLVNLSIGANVPVGGMVHNITLRADNVLDERYRDATSAGCCRRR